MIKQLILTNFKSFGKSETIDFKNLTLFAGLNSSGKSSIYQSIILLLQSIEAQCIFGDGRVPVLKINGDRLKIGQRKELLNDPENKKVCIELDTESGRAKLTYILHELQDPAGEKSEEFILSEYSFMGTHEENSKIELSLDLKTKKWKITSRRFLLFQDYRIQNELDTFLNELWRKSVGDEKTAKRDIFNHIVEFTDVPAISFNKLMPEIFYIPKEQYLNCIAPDLIEKITKEKINALIEKNEVFKKDKFLLNKTINAKFTSHLTNNNIVEIPAFRGTPERVYYDFQVSNPLLGYSPRKSDQIAYRYDLEKKERVMASLEEGLKYWVAEYFQIAQDIRINSLIPDYATEIFLNKDGKDIPINNMGFGVAQVLPVIYNILAARNDAFFIVDEPEVHLHPSAQTKIADFLFQMALIGKQILVETHSDHLINRLIFNLIKYKEHTASCKLSWISRENGEATCEDIAFDDLGYLVNSPDGFLDERKKMVDELTKLRLGSMKK